MSSPKKRPPTRKPGHASWPLMVIDGAPIRAQAKKEYQKVLRDLERSRQQIAEYESTDQPKFHQWFNRMFGALITELRETQQALETKRSLLIEIETEALRSGSSYGKAYNEVLWRREHPEPEPDPNEAFHRRSDNSKSGKGGDDIFEELFGDILGAFAEAFDEAGPYERPAREPSPPARSSSCKELYRALARRLHPDTQGELTRQQTEWWHQVQAAYEAGDVEQLRTILTLCELDEHGITDKTSVSLLQRSIKQLKLSLRALKRQLMELRREPAWGFSRLTDLEPVRARTERMLKQELFEMRQMLAAISAQLDGWARQAKSGRARTRRRRWVDQY